MTVIHNVTGRTVVICTEDDDGNVTETARYEPNGPSVSIRTHDRKPIEIGQVGDQWTTVADIEYMGLDRDLPRGGFGLHYIVPLQVALAERRRDFLVPTAPVYDWEGNKVGFATLARIM